MTPKTNVYVIGVASIVIILALIGLLFVRIESRTSTLNSQIRELQQQVEKYRQEVHNP